MNCFAGWSDLPQFDGHWLRADNDIDHIVSAGARTVKDECFVVKETCAAYLDLLGFSSHVMEDLEAA